MKSQIKLEPKEVRNSKDLTKEQANSGIVISFIQPDPTGKKGKQPYYGFRPRGGNEPA